MFYLPYTWTNFAAAAVFALASLTDWLDGWIARRYHQYSAFGAFLDPVADKLMVAVALFLIVQGHPTAWMALWAAVIVGREIAVSALREWMAELGQRAQVKVAEHRQDQDHGADGGAAAACCMRFRRPGSRSPTCSWARLVFHIGDWLLAVAALLTLWSGFAYLRAAWPVLRAGEGAAVDTSAHGR